MSETPNPYSGSFKEYYELPLDQEATESALTDSIKEKFPDQIEAFEYNMKRIKMHAGFDVPSGLVAVEGQDYGDNPLPVDGDGHVKYGKPITSKLQLQMPAVDIPVEEYKKLGSDEQAIYQMERGGMVVAGELPLFTREMLEGIYSLIGAKVEEVRSTGNNTETVRRGMYHSSPIFISQHETRYITNTLGEEAPLETFTSVTLFSESVMKAHQDSAVVNEAQRIIENASRED